MTKQELLTAFAELTGCCYQVYNWVFTGDWEVIRTDCPRQDFYVRLFQSQRCRKAVDAHQEPLPVMVTMEMILSWVCVREAPGSTGERIYVKGPFFSAYKEEAGVGNILSELEVEEERWGECRREFWKLPMLTSASSQQLALMLYYAVHQEKITVEDILVEEIHTRQRKFPGRVTADQFDRSSGAWEVEQDIVDRVRRGDPDIASIVGKLHTTVKPGMMDGKNIEYYRQNVLMLLMLVSRAAVDGGYSQKSSFSLSADYRRMLNSCTSLQELANLSDEMLIDYARRVRRSRSNLQCSGKIRLCCEYIDTHLDEKITLDLLAQKAGYTVYHLSRKFKEEMGCSIVDYMKRGKMERAKQLLATTSMDVETISAELGFGSRSYFSSVFREEVGETPTEYRRQHGVI